MHAFLLVVSFGLGPGVFADGVVEFVAGLVLLPIRRIRIRRVVNGNVLPRHAAVRFERNRVRSLV